MRDRELLGFLSSHNVLPAYSFPSTVVELRTGDILSIPEAHKVELQRDLKMAIAEYAPGGEVVAAKRIWIKRTSELLSARLGRSGQRCYTSSINDSNAREVNTTCTVRTMTNARIPSGLWPHFQEYDPQLLDREQDAALIIQRTLEYGTWEEIRWLMASYGPARIREFVRLHGERLLSAPTFTYWRKLLGLRRWRRSPFAEEARQVWPF